MTPDRRMLALALAAGLAATNLAADARADDGARSGFVVRGSGHLRGVVTSPDGKPMRGIGVHVVTRAGEQIVATDDRGEYSIQLRDADDEAAYVYVHGSMHVSGSLAIAKKLGGEEVIDIHDMVPPAVMPKPLADTRTIPAYSKRAIEANEWTRAWLLLDVSETGVVTRLRLLDDPGYDLGAIAVHDGFALRFEPARDRAQRPIRALMLWTFEWPAHDWLREHGTFVRVPFDATSVPCRGSGPTHTLYRDCRQPNLTNDAAKWITGSRPD